jgi:hypothetical protein
MRYEGISAVNGCGVMLCVLATILFSIYLNTQVSAVIDASAAQPLHAAISPDAAPCPVSTRHAVMAVGFLCINVPSGTVVRWYRGADAHSFYIGSPRDATEQLHLEDGPFFGIGDLRWNALHRLQRRHEIQFRCLRGGAIFVDLRGVDYEGRYYRMLWGPGQMSFYEAASEESATFFDSILDTRGCFDRYSVWVQHSDYYQRLFESQRGQITFLEKDAG